MDVSPTSSAFEYIKTKKKEIIDKFITSKSLPTIDSPYTIFMAGSPGAGKTEYSIKYQQKIKDINNNYDSVRIDADQIREMIPNYQQIDQADVQRASVKGVEILYDHAHHYGYNTILDGTFANRNVCQRNINTALKHNRQIEIIYIHFDPIQAWELTQKRAKLDNRLVPREVFINAYFQSKENVIFFKNKYAERIKLHLVIKKLKVHKNEYSFHTKDLFNIQNVDGYLKVKYTIGQLHKSLMII